MPSPKEAAPSTFGHEESLPRVPLPTIEETCDRFLEWCAPLLTAEELAATEGAVADFGRPGGLAHVLQAALAEYDRTDGVSSWLDDFWRVRYLGRRDRIALNANFFFLFDDTGEGQIERAAGLIAAAVAYKCSIDEERLPPAATRGEPMSMVQHKYLFSATRRPGALIDTARTPYTQRWPGPSSERHIVVLAGGSMFRVEVLGPDGRTHRPTDLASALRVVVATAARRSQPGASVGHLTTKARTEWAASRQRLVDRDPANAEALETIETALFCLCLDEGMPQDPLAAADQLLHGDRGNRWFDKALSLIVFADGTAGLNAEHCLLDGTTIVSFVDALLGSSDGEAAGRTPTEAVGVPDVVAIDFVLDGSLRDDIRTAGDAFAAYAAGTASVTRAVDDFGADAIKALRVSPDAFAQLAYQLAHHRSRGFVGSTYESISTRQYRHGRTEAMRVVSPETVAFVAAMDDPEADDAARVAAIRAAAEMHATRAKQCRAGQAPEQHLWELQLLQQRRGAELGVTTPLALYDSPGWLVMRRDYLSTSSAPSAHVQYFGFGSTSDRCIGIGYVLLADRLRLYLSTPRAVEAEMHRFADEVIGAISELRELLDRAPDPPTATPPFAQPL